jgi:hypothetical protein
VRRHVVADAPGSQLSHPSQMEEAQFKDFHSCDVGILWNEVLARKTALLL